MKYSQQMKEILASWRRCMERGLLRTTPCSALCLEYSAMEIRLKNNAQLISILEESLKKIGKLTKNEYYFLLVDFEGILLKKNRRECRQGK